MADIPEIEPKEFRAGNTIQWTRSVSDYKASESWELTYYFRGTSGTINVTSEASGDKHAITIPALTSSAYNEGTYDVTGYVSKEGTAQVDTITLAGDDTGSADTYNVTVNGNYLASAVAFTTDLATTATAIKTAIDADTALNAIVSVTTASNVLTLTAVTAGTPTTITTTVTEGSGGGGNVTGSAIVANVTPNIYTQRYSVFRGNIEILPDLDLKGSGYDHRSHVKRTLDKIEAVLENRASKEVLGSSIEGVSIQRIPHDDLVMLREKYLGWYQQELAAERIKSGLGTGRNILTRLS